MIEILKKSLNLFIITPPKNLAHLLCGNECLKLSNAPLALQILTFTKLIKIVFIPLISNYFISISNNLAKPLYFFSAVITKRYRYCSLWTDQKM